MTLGVGVNIQRTSNRLSQAVKDSIAGGAYPDLLLDVDDEYYRANGGSKAFSDVVTHSRSGNATMVDSDGLLKWAPHNLVTYSEQFDNAAWEQTGTVSITANATTAPDGTETADRLVTSGASALTQSVIQELSHTIKVWVKAVTPGTNNTFRIQGTGGRLSEDFTATGEWQLFSFTPTTLGTNDNWGLNRDSSNNPMDLYLWGAHLYRSDLGGMVDQPASLASYVPTTNAAVYLPRRGHHVYNGSAWVNEGLLHESEARTNLVTYSNDFTDSSWNSSNITYSQNVTGPDGAANSAWTATISSSGNRLRTTGNTVTAGTSYTFSFYAKKGTATGVNYAVYDVSNAAFIVSNTSYEADINETDWSRIVVTFTTPVGCTSVYVYLASGSTSAGTIYFYGAQLEAGPTPSSYIPTDGATVTRAAETLTIPSANLPWPTPQVIGDELVTNGTFDSDVTGTTPATWGTNNANASLIKQSDGTALFTSTSFAYARIQDASRPVLPVGVYQVSFEISEWVAGLVNVHVGLGVGGNVVSGNGSYSYLYTSTVEQAYEFQIRPNGGGTGSFKIDNISVREINPLSVSIQMDGRMTYADTGTAPEVVFVSWDSADDIILRMDTNGSYTGRVFFRQYDGSSVDAVADDIYTPGILVPFNIASRHGSTFINGAVDGVALTANTTPTALPDLSSTDLNLGYDYMGTIKTFRIWDKDLGDTGIEAATAPSLEPSLELVFDGSQSSFVVLDWEN